MLLNVLSFVSACSPAQKDEAIADTVYVNAEIWTGKTGGIDASVLGVKDGKVVYVGSKALKGKSRIDLGGAFMMPGFIDNHVHFMEGGAALSSVDLRDILCRFARC